jgi:hypothetical protein
MLPLGSELHGAVVKAVADLSKQVGQVAGANDPAALIQQLALAARQQQTQATPAALAGGGAPPQPQQAYPPMPPRMAA